MTRILILLLALLLAGDSIPVCTTDTECGCTVDCLD